MQHSKKNDAVNETRRESAAAFLAPILVLIALLIVFLRHNIYPTLLPESLLAYVGIGAVGATIGLLALMLGRGRGRSLTLFLLLLLALDIQTEADYKFRLIIKALQYVLQPIDSIILLSGAMFILSFSLLYLLMKITYAVRKHSGSIIATFSFVMFLGAILLPVASINLVAMENPERTKIKQVNGNTLHVILDGHIGVEGIPLDISNGAETKEAIIRFYEKWGFRLYGRAYSPYLSTLNSIPSILNGALNITDSQHISPSKEQYSKLVRNRYFESYYDKGFDIRVVQSEYLDFCSSTGIVVVNCLTYPATSIKALENSELPELSRAKLILNSFLSQSLTAKLLIKSFEYFRATGLLGHQSRSVLDFHSIQVPEAFKLAEIELRAHENNTLVFTHLLMPHAPYIWDSNCKIKQDMSTWQNRKIDHQNGSSVSNSVYRASAYQGYFEQLQCTLTLLDKLFLTLAENNRMDDLNIIIHGDHGSRITIVDPVKEQLGSVSPRDYVDSFSTHLAMKNRTVEPGYDVTPLSIVEFFSSKILNKTDIVSDKLQIGSQDISDSKKGFKSVPMVAF